MDATSAAHDRRRDRGAATVAVAVAVVVVMLVAIQAANILVFQVGRAAVRGALDEGTRLGARAEPGTEVLECEQAARTSLDNLAAGLGGGVVITCADTGSRIVATADVHFDGWLTSVADHDSTMSASSAKANQ